MIDELLHLFTLSTLQGIEYDLELAYVEPDSILILDEDKLTSTLEAVRAIILERIHS